MARFGKIVAISVSFLIPFASASSQPIACSTPVAIGTVNDKNPRVLYNDQTGETAIITERLSGLRSNKTLMLMNPGPDNVFATEDDTAKNITWPHPSKLEDTGVVANRGKLITVRTTKNLGYPTIGGSSGAKVPKLMSLRLFDAGLDNQFRTTDDKREREIKAIRFDASANYGIVKTGIGDELVAWVYGKKVGNTQRLYVGGCDLRIARGQPGSCTRRGSYDLRIPANLAGSSLATVISSPILPVRLQVGTQSIPVVVFRIGTSSNQQTLIFRMQDELVYNAGLGNRTPMTWMSNNRLFTSRPNGNGVIYEAATPDGMWNFDAPLWSYLTEVPPHNGGMRVLSVSDTEDAIVNSQAYIGSYTRVEHHTFSPDRYYKRYYFVRPFGLGSAFFLELNDEAKQPDTFAVGGDTVAFHRYNPGNGAYLGIGVMTCR